MRGFSLFIIGLILFTSQPVFGQIDTLGWGTNYPAVAERKIVETKWRYTYAIHLESNTTIHKAEKYYEYFLYFRYNYSYQQYLNGRMTKGKWALEGSELLYSFKRIKKFEIAEITKSNLVLEFKQPNSKGTYQYHFIRVESKDAPFVKPANELPDVIVETIDTRKKKKGLFAFGKKKKRKKKRKKRKKKKDEVYINIELVGGGYYGGIDPVLRDYIHIKSDGRLVKEFKTKNNGLTVTKKNIPRDELEKFAEFVSSKGFFEYQRIFECEDSFCQKRKKASPRPIPLRLAIAYGKRKKVVTISIWGEDKNKVRFVNYPPELDAIIEAIQRMAHRV